MTEGVSRGMSAEIRRLLASDEELLDVFGRFIHALESYNKEPYRAAMRRLRDRLLTSTAEPSPTEELRARIRTRIHSLVNRGTEICVEYQPREPLASVPGCDRCGYSADVHTLRDVLAAEPSPVDAQPEWPRQAYENILRRSALNLTDSQIVGISLLSRECFEKWATPPASPREGEDEKKKI